MTGYAFCTNWLAFRKLFPEERFPFDNEDPSTIQDCADPSKCTWKLVRLSTNVLYPLLVAITLGIAHTLRTTLVTNEKSAYPIYLGLFDPLLRLGSKTLCVINSPGEAASDSSPTSPDGAATGGRTRIRTANKKDGPSGQSAVPDAAATVGDNEQVAGENFVGQVAAALGLNEQYSANNSVPVSIKSLRMAFETELKAGGSEEPIEFIIKDADGKLEFIVEVKKTLESAFDKSLGQICHQLIAMALKNHKDGRKGPVRGFLTDAYTWIGVEFTLTHVPPSSGGRDIMLKELRGQFRCSGAHQGLVRGRMTTGFKLDQDFELVISTLAESLIKDVANVNVAASLKSYADQMRTAAAQLLAGHPHIGELEQLLGLGNEPAVQGAAEPAAKRQKIEDGQSVADLVQAAMKPAWDYSFSLDHQQLLPLSEKVAAAVRRLLEQCVSEKMGVEGVQPAVESVLAATKQMQRVAQQPADKEVGAAASSFIKELNQLKAALTKAAETHA